LLQRGEPSLHPTGNLGQRVVLFGLQLVQFTSRGLGGFRTFLLRLGQTLMGFRELGLDLRRRGFEFLQTGSLHFLRRLGQRQ